MDVYNVYAKMQDNGVISFIFLRHFPSKKKRPHDFSNMGSWADNAHGLKGVGGGVTG